MVTLPLKTTSPVRRTPVNTAVKTKMKAAGVQLVKVLSISSLLLLFVNHYVESKVAYVIKIEGRRGAGNDIYLIAGKNCDSPTLIKRSKGRNKHKRGKIIIIEKECDPNHDTSHIVHKIPVFVPTNVQPRTY